MAYLSATVETLVKKGLKKAMKGKRHKRNRTYDSSSSDSDSKQGIGSRDMEYVVDKRRKLDKPFMSDLQFTQHPPIKVMDPISNSNRADVKALENAKTVLSRLLALGNTAWRSLRGQEQTFNM